MAKITQVSGLEILDSRGNPTIQVTVKTDEGFEGIAAVPSGASTGEAEALELRDGDKNRYFGKGVHTAISHVEGPLASLLIGRSPLEQKELDLEMIAADGTPNKQRFGANAILGVSLALARAGALTAHVPLYEYLHDKNVREYVLPCPMMNVINGGVHADNLLDFQEFMIRPKKAESFAHAVRMGAEIFHVLKSMAREQGYSTAVGDEGGLAPNLPSHEAALELILGAIEKAGYRPGEEVSLALDLAASYFFDTKTGSYIAKKRKGMNRTAEEHVFFLEGLVNAYPIDSIEDGMAENDWTGWQLLTKRLGKKVQLVGDDNFVTSTHFLKKGIDLHVANAILIKVNQIGTLTEALACMAYAKENGYQRIVSHRSGETEDVFIADLAVATGAGQIKTGSLCRSDRVAKYNRLLAIEKELGSGAVYQDSNPF